MTASHDAHQNGQSILSDVARHEGELLARIEAAENEARKTIERARADAAKLLSDETSRAEAEASRTRDEAARAREANFTAAVTDAGSRLESRRAAALGRVGEMAGQVLDMFVPKGGAS